MGEMLTAVRISETRESFNFHGRSLARACMKTILVREKKKKKRSRKLIIMDGEREGCQKANQVECEG
jgi:hypothetical protein